MLVRDTLTEAMALARSRGNRTVWLVLSLEGAVYFVFFSRQDVVGLANTNAYMRVALNAQIRGEVPPANGAAYQQVWNGIRPTALQAATHSVVDPTDRHAEESMIEQWDPCVAAFVAGRGRTPRKAEIFLSHSPCFPTAAQPSPPRMLAGAHYPASCEEKLKTFAGSGTRSLMRWSVYYERAFGGRTVPQANFQHQNLRVLSIPGHVQLPG